ncbi:hypothetical protein [Nocardia puris]|uniref:Uncharacterized protein n=1 Tax=Nocardia puris TaxID=208602 RepID=A0A366D914_9NOCA|nr:hypothetical protein [Nocardia puris]RBO86530.1 hypothetical protein DFR74_11373 [Nocardia puris]
MKRVRQTHRWMGVTFAVVVVVTVVVLGAGGPEWMSYVPLLPLAVLFVSGVSLLVGWWRGGRAVSGVRQWHRWLATAFVISVLVTTVTLAASGPAWVSYIPLLPLLGLLFSGLYMFIRTSGAARGIPVAR